MVRYFLTLALIASALALSSCSQAPIPAAEVLLKAKPTAVVKPTTQAVSETVSQTSQMLSEAKVSNAAAKAASIDISKAADAVTAINEKFTQQIKDLQLTNSAAAEKMADLRVQFSRVVTFLEDKVRALQTELTTSAIILTDAEEKIQETTTKISDLDKQIERSQSEVERYRQLYDIAVQQVSTSSKAAEQYKADAAKNKTYRSIFWIVVAVLGILLSLCLTLKFKPSILRF